MSGSRKIPIRDKKTGEETLGKSIKPKSKQDAQPLESDHGSTPADFVRSPDRQGEAGPRNHVDSDNVAPDPDKAKGSQSGKASKKKPRQEIETLEQFISYAYSRKGQRVGLKPKVIKSICKSPKLDEQARHRLHGLSRSDVLLAVPRQLLLTAREIEGYPVLKNAIRTFVRGALADHVAFSSPDLSAVLNNLPDAPDPRTALITVAGTDYSHIGGSDEARPLKGKDFETLRTNAVYCLAAWFAETRGIGLEKLGQYLFESLWSPQASTKKEEVAQLRALTEIRDMAGAGLACLAYKKQAERQIQVADSAKKGETAALNTNQELREINERLRKEQAEREERIATLAKTIEAEKQDHEHTRLHLRDDLEQLRTRLLRRLKAEVNLLDEGLHALRREPPKIRVMEDHAERALEGLKKEIKVLGTED